MLNRKRFSNTGFVLVELVLILSIVLVIGVVGYSIYQKTHTTSTNSNAAATGKLASVPPNGHAYLGAFVNPQHITISIKNATRATPGSNVIEQLPTFNKLIGKPVAILHFYMPFDSPVPTTTLDSIDANGSIPLISWGCRDLTSVTSGAEDSYITSYADSLKSFGKPVYLRWYWEMNQVNKDGGQPAGAKCGGYNNGPLYVSAWKHIYSLFQTAGAHNVAFVWCPGYSGGNYDTYYPGDAYVDWISVDRYERTYKEQPFLDFNGMFGSYYQEWASHSKPIMIAETAGMGGSEQAQYLSDTLAQAPQMPQIKAFVYFDATGQAGDWQLKDQGITAFQELVNSAYFSAR